MNDANRWCAGSGRVLQVDQGPVPDYAYCPECARFLRTRAAWSPNGAAPRVQLPRHQAVSQAALPGMRP